MLAQSGFPELDVPTANPELRPPEDNREHLPQVQLVKLPHQVEQLVQGRLSPVLAYVVVTGTAERNA